MKIASGLSHWRLACLAMEWKPPWCRDCPRESTFALWQVNSDTLGEKSTERSLHSYFPLSLDPSPCLVTTLDKGEPNHHPDLFFLIPRDATYKNYREKVPPGVVYGSSAAELQPQDEVATLLGLLNSHTAIFLKRTWEAILPLFKNFSGPPILMVGS